MRKKVLAKGLESVVEVGEGDVRNMQSIADGSVDKVGFREICAHYFETNVRLGYEVAVKQLKQWKIDKHFGAKYQKDLLKHGRVSIRTGNYM